MTEHFDSDFELGTAVIANGEESSVTLEDIMESVDKLDRLRRNEPFYRLMREVGYDPDDNWILLFPKSEFDKLPANARNMSIPNYVCISDRIEYPVVMKATNSLFGNFSVEKL